MLRHVIILDSSLGLLYGIGSGLSYFGGGLRRHLNMIDGSRVWRS